MTTPPATLDARSQAAHTSFPHIHWPPAYRPATAPVAVRNEIEIPVPPSQVWAWLLRAELWPAWYSNAAAIHFLSHSGPDLRNRSRFRWKTFGLTVTSKVLEFHPPNTPEAPARLAWDAHTVGLNAFHAWLLTPLPNGHTHVLTEEVQHGWLARLGKFLFPRRMQTQHQLWLEALSRQAQSGPPTRA